MTTNTGVYVGKWDQIYTLDGSIYYYTDHVNKSNGYSKQLKQSCQMTLFYYS